MTLEQELKEKGFLNDATAGCFQHLDGGSRSVYCGIDPTADNIHVGTLVQLATLATLKKYGHEVYLLTGDFTATIGDPTGRTKARTTPTPAQVSENSISMVGRIESLGTPFRLYTNRTWYSNMDFGAFIDMLARAPSLNYMLNLKFIKERMKHDDMTFLEMMYPMFQGYDFLELYRRKGVTVQIGGSDQMGNIAVGTKMGPVRVKLYGFTTNLLCDEKGNKIGKTTGGNFWVTKEMADRIFKTGLDNLDYDAIRGLA